MTRMQVFHEGVDTVLNNRQVAKGALQLSEKQIDGEPLPVVINYVASMIVAWATKMERDDEGRISFEIEFVTDRFKRIYGDLPIGIYATNIESEFSPEHNRNVAVKATLKGLSFFDSTSPDMGRSLS